MEGRVRPVGEMGVYDPKKGVWYERTQPSMSYDGMSFPGVRATSLVVDARRKRGEKDA